MSSGEDSSSESGGRGGFVWGNIDDRGRLDEGDKAEYPEELRDDIDDNDVVVDLSQKILSGPSGEDSLALGDAVNRSYGNNEFALNDEDRMLAARAAQNHSPDSSESEDFDADSDGDVEMDQRPSAVPAPKAELPFRFTVALPVLTQPANDEDYSLSVLRHDVDGTPVLKLSEMYIGSVRPFVEGISTRRSRRKVSSIFIEGDSKVALGNENAFLDAFSGSGQGRHALGDKKQIPRIQKRLLQTWEDFPQGEPLIVPNHTVCKIDLCEQVFSLLEQLPWEHDIIWDEKSSFSNEPVPGLKDSPLSVNSSGDLANIAAKSNHDVEKDEMVLSDVGEDLFEESGGRAPAPVASRSSLPLAHRRVHLKFRKRKRSSYRQWKLPTGKIAQDPVGGEESQHFESWLTEEDTTRHCRQPTKISLNDGSVPPSLLIRPHVNAAFDSMDWISTIVWDDTNPPARPFLTSLILDKNDDNMIFDVEAAIAASSLGPGQARFNLSLDQTDLYKGAIIEERAIVGRAAVQHALFAQELARPIYKSHFTSHELRWFHRPRAHFDQKGAYVLFGKAGGSGGRPIDHILSRKYVPKKESELSARDGRVILMEFIEQSPPLMQNVGMASELVTFYRQKDKSDTSVDIEPVDGVLRILSPEKDEDSPFIADVKRGSTVRSIVNNLFSAPIFQHDVPSTDFLLVRSAKRANWSMRPIPALYVVGQTQFKTQVKTPNARDANAAIKEMLSVFIYRLLRKHPTLLIADVFEAFPCQSETSIRAKLKEVADFQRGGHESGCWILNTERQKLPSESAIREMVTPEMMCEFSCMRAGQHRLEALGIEELLLWTPQLAATISKVQADALRRQLEYIEEELQLTPWSVTSNFIAAREGRCLLKLQGPGNPLGRGAGFSYIKAPHRFEVDPTAPKIAPAKALTGTDKDLRKLNMHGLYAALVSFGIPEQHVKTLPRWKRVGLLRDLSSDATLNGENNQFNKFARQQRNTNRVQHDRFSKEAQKIFDRQCEILGAKTPPQLDDRSSEDEADEIAADLEDHLGDKDKASGGAKQSSVILSEEAEYEQFLKEQSERQKVGADRTEGCLRVNKSEPSTTMSKKPGKQRTVVRRRLRRREIISDADGIEQERVQIIDDPVWVEAFVADQLDPTAGRLKALEEDLASNPPGSSRAAARKGVAPFDDVTSFKDGVSTLTGHIGASPLFGGATPSGEFSRSGLSRKKGDGKGRKSTVRSSVKRRLKDLKNRPTRTLKPRPNKTPVLGPNGKPMVKCSSCHTFGHTKSNRKCPNHPDNVVLKVTDQESNLTLSLARLPTPKRTGEAPSDYPQYISMG